MKNENGPSIWKKIAMAAGVGLVGGVAADEAVRAAGPNLAPAERTYEQGDDREADYRRGQGVIVSVGEPRDTIVVRPPGEESGNEMLSSIRVLINGETHQYSVNVDEMNKEYQAGTPVDVEYRVYNDQDGPHTIIDSIVVRHAPKE